MVSRWPNTRVRFVRNKGMANRKRSGKSASSGASRGGRKLPASVPAGKSPNGKASSGLAGKLDPTRPDMPGPVDGGETRRPIQALVRRAEGSLPAAIARRFVDVELLPHSAALALYAMLSLAPLLLILVWLTSMMLPDAQEALMEQIALLLGSDAEQVARTILRNARERPDTGSMAGLWSLLLLMFGATAVFARLQDVLNKIFRTDATRLPGLLAWLRKRVFSLGLVLALGFLLLVSMTVGTVLQLAFASVDWMLPVLANLATWLIYVVAFALMYHYLPDRSVSWKHAFAGGAATAALFVLGRTAIGWYLDRAEPESAYGSMGALMLALLWIYYSALVVFLGALITAVVDERRKAHKAQRHGATSTRATRTP